MWIAACWLLIRVRRRWRPALIAMAGQRSRVMKVERVTDRTRESGSRFKAQGSKVEVRTEVVRDTVYIEHRDTVEVQKLDLRFSFFAPRQYSSKLGNALGLASVQGTSSSLNPHPSALRSALPLGSAKNYLKWIFALICAIVVLMVVIRLRC